MEYEINKNESEITDQDRANTLEYVNLVVSGDNRLSFQNPNYPKLDNGDYFVPKQEEMSFYIGEYFTKPLEEMSAINEEHLQKARETRVSHEEAYRTLLGTPSILINERGVKNKGGVQRLLESLSNQKANLKELEDDRYYFSRIMKVLKEDTEFVAIYLSNRGFCISIDI